MTTLGSNWYVPRPPKRSSGLFRGRGAGEASVGDRVSQANGGESTAQGASTDKDHQGRSVSAGAFAPTADVVGGEPELTQTGGKALGPEESVGACLGARSGRGGQCFRQGQERFAHGGKPEVLMYEKCALGVQNPGEDPKRMKWSCCSALGPGPPMGCRKNFWSALGPGRLPLGWQKKNLFGAWARTTSPGVAEKSLFGAGASPPPWGGRKFFVRRLSPEPPLGFRKNF